MEGGVTRGVLKWEDGESFLLGTDGERHLESELIWEGYPLHWLGKRVCARHLPQRDYIRGKPIVVMWPDDPGATEPSVDLFYNERLVKYPFSILGHIAIEVNGRVFNFSHLLNENEHMTMEEYLYRPPLGEFAPDPRSGRINVDDPEKHYYDKFGRRFMRSIHVLRIRGLDGESLDNFFSRELAEIKNAPVDPKKREKYSDFNLFTRSCTTIIRDGLRLNGLPRLRGIFPRELFVNAAYQLIEQAREGSIRMRLFKMEQLKVPEAPYSVPTPLLNPLNRFRQRRLKSEPMDLKRGEN
jgi:hypothetical protein